jgi:aldose 1-epimerase
LKVDLALSMGGAIAGFWHNGTPLMRETPDDALRQGLVRQTSSYPLIPYSNRIAHGRFSFRGIEHQLALNFGEHPHSIHGNAWQNPWQVDEAGDTHCRFSFLHRPLGNDAKAWPFAYRAEQVFALSPDGLMITLLVENMDHRAMPAGLGLHPFFPKRPGVRLKFAAGYVYQIGPDSLPAACIPVPAEWDYRVMRDVDEPGLDNCFEGWEGKADILFEQEGILLRLDADPVYGHLVAYVPRGRDFFAVEPVTHLNDAINRPDIVRHGLHVLQSRELLTGTVRFGVEVR